MVDDGDNECYENDYRYFLNRRISCSTENSKASAKRGGLGPMAGGTRVCVAELNYFERRK